MELFHKKEGNGISFDNTIAYDFCAVDKRQQQAQPKTNPHKTSILFPIELV